MRPDLEALSLLAALSLFAPRASAEEREPAPGTAPGEHDKARLDYSDGTFYLRGPGDRLVLATGGRVHVDSYGFFGPGVSDYRRSNGSALAPNLFFRRFVLESGGLIRRDWFFWVGGNFAPTSIDGNQGTTSTAAVYDGFVGYQRENQQLYVGQFNIPVSMDNVTSSRWLDMMERPLSVRTMAAPYNKDLGVMWWGSAFKRGVLEYQLGLFGGDGMNRPNVDHAFDGMGRILVRPFAGAHHGVFGRAHVGVSGRFGTRQDDFVRYDAAALSTPGGYAFWSPSYKAADGTEMHVLPSGAQIAGAAEIYVPLERFDVKGELVRIDEGRREAPQTDRSLTARHGSLSGTGTYLQLSYWPVGRPRINGHPAGRAMGLRPPRDHGAEAPFGLQLVLRGEVIRLAYDANDRSARADDGGLSARTTNVRVNALQFGVNYWATKHVRVTAEYSLYHFPGAPSAAGANMSNQAAAPGARAPSNDATANTLHEVSFRLGLAL